MLVAQNLRMTKKEQRIRKKKEEEEEEMSLAKI